MTVLRHWLEADEQPHCQHCPALADERSFMCEDCAGEADAERDTLAEQLEGAVGAIAAHRAAIESIGTIRVGDDESRERAEAKRAADLALWRHAGGATRAGGGS